MTNNILSTDKNNVVSLKSAVHETVELPVTNTKAIGTNQERTDATRGVEAVDEQHFTETAGREMVLISNPENQKTETASSAAEAMSAGVRASHNTRHVAPGNNESDDDDVASKAALALAAVAAAATANNKSPAEAAREARAVAQSIISTNSGMEKTYDSTYSVDQRVVDLSFVKKQLLLLAERTPLTDRLARGHNDAFLQHLLLMEFFTCMQTVSDQGKTSSDQESIDLELVKEACARVENIIKRVEGAYDSLVDMLPKESRRLIEDIGPLDTPECPMVIPDLLPPCVTREGDATEAFFRVCAGDSFEFEEESGATSITHSTSINAGPDVHGGNEELSMDAGSSSPTRQGSVFNYMFRRSSGGTKGLGQVFRKKPTRRQTSTSALTNQVVDDIAPPNPTVKAGEYVVRIEREMLGLTVENVLERTLVRTVLPGGPAKKAGAKVGSLIVKVGNVETRNLTHFETIDELRQSQRPLHLVLRHVDDDSIRSAREEMGRLIQGAGFGIVQEGFTSSSNDQQLTQRDTVRPLIANDLRIDAFTKRLQKRLEIACPVPKNKKEEVLSRLGESLIWILSLLIVGLEREAARVPISTESTNSTSATTELTHHIPKDYGDASRSVAKVLLDYTRKKLDKKDGLSQAQNGSSVDVFGAPQPPPHAQHRGKAGRRLVVTPYSASNANSSMSHDKPLLLIGDVLQRIRTFLADTSSPPAALLRGELIAFLSNVLDIDTEMELAEEESASAGVDRIKSGSINDLGSAGTLLKLIVLNCAAMRSPGCHELSSKRRDAGGRFLDVELRRRFGSRDDLSTSDLHRLHAGNRFLAVVHRLAASRSISARIAACSLAPVLWGHLDFPHTLQLRGVITRALHDVEVVVRKATATVLHEIAELVFDRRSVPWLVLMCERAMTDPEPQLRCAAMTLTWHLAENLPNAFLGDASQGSRYLRRLPSRSDPIFADVYLLQCKLLPVATRLAEDRSPSVRLAVAAQCDRLCDALGDHWSSVVIDVLLALLSDIDESVRCEAVCCVPRLAEIVLLSSSPGEVAASEVSVLEALIPSAIKLQKDKISSVRVALAGAAGELLTLFVDLQNRVTEICLQGDHQSERQHDVETGKAYKRQVDDRLIPLVQTLLNDSDPEVTSAALRAVTNATRSSVHHSRSRHMSIASEDDSISLSSYHSHSSRDRPVFLPVLSENQVIRLLPTLTELSGSRQWRVRQSAVEIVPALLGCTQKLETRLMISKLCVGLLSDKVDAVRRTAAECLCLGGGCLGSHGEDVASEWVASVVIPTIRRCAAHSASKQRLLSLKMIEIVFQNGSCPTRWSDDIGTDGRSTSSPMQEMIAIALSLCNDRIANIRLNVGRVLEPAIHMFDMNEISLIAESMREQIQREEEKEKAGDHDVLFFARKCLAKVELFQSDRDNSSSND